MTYKLIRSSRKTVSVEVRADGVTVRAPMKMPASEIEKFVRKHEKWIEKNVKKVEEQKGSLAGVPPLTKEEIRALAERAARYIPERAAFYAPKIGVGYAKITIRCQRTKWGSCSAKGNLNFNCLLMLAPPEAIDSVVVHELCHRKEMNHSDRFYSEVLRVFPEYKKWDRWLKDNGAAILARAGEGR